MIESCDTGSLPFVGDLQKYLKGASDFGQVINDSVEFFEKKAVEGFLDKAEAGIDVPNYPQHRDMTQMFLDMIDGVEKTNGGYIEAAQLRLKPDIRQIPEISAIRNRIQEIYERLREPLKLRICITGPYTMSSLFTYKDKATFTRLGRVLTDIIEANVFTDKHGKVQIVSIDEPLLGFVDDPLLDHGSKGRENLLKAWDNMAGKVRARGAQACLHLHNTSDELFWETKSVSLLESHVSDPFYEANRTKEKLESTDKFLKASITVTDFDELIRNHVTVTSGAKFDEISVNEKIADTWEKLKHGKIDPMIFLEDTALMRKRLRAAIERFGSDRILYAGPECGLRGFPSYESALECLRRVAQATKSFTK